MPTRFFIAFSLLITFHNIAHSQNVMTPDLLWKLGRVGGESISPDGKNVIYGVTNYDMEANKGERNLYSIPVNGGGAKQITTTAGTEYNVQVTPSGKMGYLSNGQWWEGNWDGTDAKQVTTIEGGIDNVKFSTDGKYVLFSQEVKIQNTVTERYPDLQKANAHGADDLMYRHWDGWDDGAYNHVFYAAYTAVGITNPKDIMQGEAYDSPQTPFGGAEDFTFDAAATGIFYVCKKKSGKEAAVSTNSDIWYYSIANGTTVNITADGKGYDTQPQMAPKSNMLAFTSMARDGYEADKNDLVVLNIATSKKYNLTKDWDETVESFRWSNDGSKIYFLAVKEGTEQLFEISLQKDIEKNTATNIRQVTNGPFDLNAIVGQSGDWIIASKSDMNHANELVRVNLKTGEVTVLTSVNKVAYEGISLSRVDKVWMKTTDGQKMLTWVIYPPDFDATKKYPTLLYCQGGPQSAVSQFYSFRWNFQLMAANGYIVVAPNRRGLPGFGTKWNEDISQDWGGQAIKDYLAAIDSAATWSFVDKSRLGAVGASYGGYSVYMLEGASNGRFKSMISHCGVFDLNSWYATTEEIWFANWDVGGPFWLKPQPKSYMLSNPVNFIDRWRTPIMVIEGERDYRIPYTQGLAAYQYAQLKGIKSRLLVFPDEGHWILKPQNSLLWQREFFRWLDETLKN
ncbi:MAG: S9 family peptidase [Chitinophagales bacterium]